MVDAEVAFRSGQRWSCNTADGEGNCSIVILKLDELDGEVVVHVAVIGEIGAPSHMPFSELAVRKSVGSLLDHSVELPEYLEGYLLWAQEHENGKAGVYRITVSEALNL